MFVPAISSFLTHKTPIQTYTSILAIFKPSKPSLQTHVTFVLFCTLATYTYRDIWPLLTYTQQPKDVLAWPLYFNLLFLAIGGLFIPLFAPRPYVPVDPNVRLLANEMIFSNTD